MTSTKLLGYLVALCIFAIFLVASVSAFGQIIGLEVSEVDAFTHQPIAVSAGDTVPVRVFFKADETVEDVRVKAWISGDKEFAAVTKEFAVIEGRTYSWLLSLQLPKTLDEEDLQEDLSLFVTVESRDLGQADSFGTDLTLQRESNAIEILDVSIANEVTAGEVLNLDVVVKNRGRQQAEDTFVVARIPALKLEDRAYFGDLTPKDQGGNDEPEEQDSRERRLSLRIPANAPAGVYLVEIEASNDDASTTVTKKVAIGGTEEETMIVSPVHSKSFNVGESAEYTMVLVNSGNRLSVFELVIEAPGDLNIDVSEPVIAVPAGTSKTVKLDVSADKIGSYNFAVNVHSGSELISREEFSAKVEGREGITTAASPTVLLTVILAIIFVVLLIVLIVLLTRKPARTEEVGESYY